MKTLAQISDTHLSPTYGWFHGNFLSTAAEVNALAPDLVINSGDIALSAPDHATDLPFAAWCHGALDAPVRFIPGNHDIGEEPGGEILRQPLSEDLLAHYRGDFGPDWWAADLGDWRLIGLNTQILGTGLAQEAEQEEWLKETLSEAGKPIGVFVHKPLFLERPDEEPFQERTVPGWARDKWIKMFNEAGVRFVACGHMHQHKDVTEGGIRFIWAPSTAYMTTHPLARTETALGYLVYRFDGDNFSVEMCQTQDAAPLTFYDFFDPKVHRGLKDVPPAPPDAASQWRVETAE